MVNEQWGFRRERSTRDVILVARIVAELSSAWERNLEGSRSAMDRASTWERNAESWETEYKVFKETQPMLYLADIKKAYPSAPRQPMWDLLKWFSPTDSGSVPASPWQNIIHREAQIGWLRSVHAQERLERGMRIVMHVVQCVPQLCSRRVEQSDPWNTFEMLALIALQWENERRPKRCTAGRRDIAMPAHSGFRG